MFVKFNSFFNHRFFFNFEALFFFVLCKFGSILSMLILSNLFLFEKKKNLMTLGYKFFFLNDWEIKKMFE